MRNFHLRPTGILLFYLFTSLWFTGCEKQTDTTTNSGTGNGGGSGSDGTGNAMFWIAADLGCGPITVLVNGQSKTITSFYGTSPACGTSGCANFTLAPGTYTYSASCSGKTWSNTITVTAGGCSKMQLTSSGSGGSSGGSAGGGSGGSNTPSCTNMNAFVSATGTWINDCGSGGKNDLSVKVTNSSNKTLYIRILFKKKNGTFDCRGLTVAAGKSGTQSACSVSDYRFSAILDTEFGNNCMGDCQF